MKDIVPCELPPSIPPPSLSSAVRREQENREPPKTRGMSTLLEKERALRNGSKENHRPLVSHVSVEALQDLLSAAFLIYPVSVWIT